MIIDFTTFFITFAVAALIPGIDTMSIISTYLYNRNTKDAVLFLSGVVLAKLTLFSLVFWGADLLIQVIGEKLTILKFFGGAYLLWLGIKIFLKNDNNEQHYKGTVKTGVFTAYFLGMTNIQAVLFYVAVLPLTVSLDNLNFFAYITMCIIIIFTMGSVGYIYIQIAKNINRIAVKYNSNKINRIFGITIIMISCLLFLLKFDQ